MAIPAPSREARGILIDLVGATSEDAAAAVDQLLAEFGGIGPVLAAAPVHIARVIGHRPAITAALVAAREAMLVALRREISDAPVLSKVAALDDYLHAAMAHNAAEQVRGLFLDAKLRLIRDEVLATGSVDQASCSPRVIMKRALELAASGVILVHNHPSGDPMPSKADIRYTKAVKEAARSLEIELHDHIVIARAGGFSFLRHGLL